MENSKLDLVIALFTMGRTCNVCGRWFEIGSMLNFTCKECRHNPRPIIIQSAPPSVTYVGAPPPTTTYTTTTYTNVPPQPAPMYTTTTYGAPPPMGYGAPPMGFGAPPPMPYGAPMMGPPVGATVTSYGPAPMMPPPGSYGAPPPYY